MSCLYVSMFGPAISKDLLYVLGFLITPTKYKTSLIAMGCVRVSTHFGAIIIGNFSHKSLMISNDELPEPTIIPALKQLNYNFQKIKYVLHLNVTVNA